MNPMTILAAVTPRALGLAMLVLAAPGAFAQSMVNARVLSATPVYEAVPVGGCAPGMGAAPSGVGTAVGALVGGLIGSQLGKGSGHIAGAILGTVGGAVLGNTAEAQQRYYGGGCATQYQNRVAGYDVAYEWGGRQYHTRMGHNPGPWLQVPAPAGYYGERGPDALGMDGGYGAAPYPQAQAYPVAPPPMAGDPLPAYPAAGESSGVVTAPPGAVYGGAYPYPSGYPQPAYPAPGYPQAYPQAYPQGYPPPVYARPAPAYVTPVGISLSVGGGFGHRGRGGWSVGVGSGW